MQARLMWKRSWRTWTVDKPAAFGDWLWDVFVVQFAAFLDRLTLRQVIAFIPALILIVAYAHKVPISPGLLLVGDLLAYIDIFSMILLLSLLGRAATILYMLRQAAESIGRFVSHASTMLRRPGARHRRVPGTNNRRRSTTGAKGDDDGPVPIYGIAWA